MTSQCFLGMSRIAAVAEEAVGSMAARSAPFWIRWMGAFMCVPVCMTVMMRQASTPCWACLTPRTMLTSVCPGYDGTPWPHTWLSSTSSSPEYGSVTILGP